MKSFNLSLAAYGDIKKMTYEEMSRWAAGLYQKAYKAGAASVTAAEAFPAALENALQSAEDIGPIRARSVMQAIAKVLCASEKAIEELDKKYGVEVDE